MITIIAAIGKNNELGIGNKLLWNLPSDMKFFKDKTMGHPVVMGKRTYESIGRPLPGRRNIVISSSLKDEKVEVVKSVEEALKLIENDDVYIIGGASIYEQFLPYTDQMYLTLVDDSPAADVFFPKFDYKDYEITKLEEKEENGLKLKFTFLRRIK